MLRHRGAEGTAINKHIIVGGLSWELGCGWRLLGRNLSLNLMYDRSPFPSLCISLNDGGGDEVVGYVSNTVVCVVVVVVWWWR